MANLALLNPGGDDLPDAIEDELDFGFATALAFNHSGSLLAVGCNDGRIVLCDFLARSVARDLAPHVLPVTELGFSHDDRRLLSASADWTVSVWDLERMALAHTFTFESLVLSAAFHPTNRDLVVVCSLYEAPMLIDLATGKRTRLVVPLDGGDDGARVDTHSVAAFSRVGHHVFVGTSRGDCAAFDVRDNLRPATCFKSGGPIKVITFSPDGKRFLLNCSDRIIRIYTTSEVLAGNTAPDLMIQDQVNRVQWKACVFSRDGENLIAGASVNEHKLEIYNIRGRLVRILEGPKEGVLEIAWHPTQPIIASSSASGGILIWSKSAMPNWSAFAPDFTELEENEEYMEREDEFDMVSEDESKKRKRSFETDETEDVDIGDPVAVAAEMPFTIPVMMAPDQDGVN